MLTGSRMNGVTVLALRAFSKTVGHATFLIIVESKRPYFKTFVLLKIYCEIDILSAWSDGLFS